MTKVTTPALLSAILAMDENRLIGKNNQLPWHLPADLKHFKTLTLGKPILMGRKTYESIGKPLPKRINIVMTRDENFTAPGCIVVHSIQDALQFAAAEQAPEIVVIGGAHIYQQLLPFTQRIYMTIVHHQFEGDTYFPELDRQAWKEIECSHHAADAENHYAYSFLTLERKQEK